MVRKIWKLREVGKEMRLLYFKFGSIGDGVCVLLWFVSKWKWE